MIRPIEIDHTHSGSKCVKKRTKAVSVFHRRNTGPVCRDMKVAINIHWDILFVVSGATSGRGLKIKRHAITSADVVRILLVTYQYRRRPRHNDDDRNSQHKWRAGLLQGKERGEGAR